MNNNFSMTHVKSMSNFISEKEKELALIFHLLGIQNVVKKFKGDLCMNHNESVAFVYRALQDCSLVLLAFMDDSYPGVNYLERFDEKAKIVVGLINDLKKKTNFFRTTILGDILEDLEKATTKFINTAN